MNLLQILHINMCFIIHRPCGLRLDTQLCPRRHEVDVSLRASDGSLPLGSDDATARNDDQQEAAATHCRRIGHVSREVSFFDFKFTAYVYRGSATDKTIVYKNNKQ